MPDDFPFNVWSFVQTFDVCAESSMTDERRAGFKFIGEGNYYKSGGLKLKRKGEVSYMSCSQSHLQWCHRISISNWALSQSAEEDKGSGERSRQKHANSRHGKCK